MGMNNTDAAIRLADTRNWPEYGGPGGHTYRTNAAHRAKMIAVNSETVPVGVSFCGSTSKGRICDLRDGRQVWRIACRDAGEMEHPIIGLFIREANGKFTFVGICAS